MPDVQSGECAIKLPGALDLPAAAELVAALQKAIESRQPVTIDASGVETVTMPCIQIVLSAIKAETPVSVVDPSIAFTNAFMDLGLIWNQEPAIVAPAAVSEAPPSPEAEAAEPPAQTAATGESDKAPANKRILTIDDSKTMRDMLMLTLSSSGFEVVQAVDGQDGLDVLEKETVDVVITDINMPKMDGYGVIQNLRKNPIYDATPILVLTTESDREKKERARELGATGFIVKPFNPASLVEVIRKVSP